MIGGKRLLRTVIPHADESFVGYVIRLTEINDYDTPSWILQLAGIQKYMQSKVCFSFNDKLDLQSLATLTGVEESRLTSLIYQPIDNSKRKFCNHLVFGSPAPKYIIRPKLFKVCPGCLREATYVRKIWELTPVTACPIHKCLLLDQCPSCARRLPYNRSRVSCCQCKFDWRETYPKTIHPAELATSQQMHALCNLPRGIGFTIEEPKGNPLYALELLDFISALFFIASQYRAISYMSGKRRIGARGKGFNSPMTNDDTHSLLCRAFSTYDNWPVNFFSFLNWRREHSGNSKHSKGLVKDFAEYKYALYRQLGSPSLNFIREAFEDYLSAHWHGGYISGIKRVNHVARQKKKYVSFNEAVKLLKVGRSGLKSLIAEGRLNAIVRPVGKTNMTLIELSHIDELRAKLGQLLFTTQAKSILGVDRELMPELVKYNLLRLHRHPTDLSNPHRYNLKDINDLLITIKKKVLKRDSLRGHKKISFTVILRKFRNYGIGLGGLVKLILDGNISPCNMEVGRGLGGLQFYECDVTNYQRELIKVAVDDAVRVGEAARLVGLDKTRVYLLIIKGLLAAKTLAISNRRTLFVTTRSIDNFHIKYVLAAGLAQGLNTASTYLTRLLIAEGVQPISGPIIDKGKCYIFRKRDLEKIDLKNLINRERRHQRSRAISPLVNLNEASKLLGISSKLIQEYVENGILKPYKLARSSSDKRELCFTRRTIENFKTQATDFRGLVSASVAASMLNNLIRNFYVKYVQTGRLKKVLGGGKPNKWFFRRKDIEAIVELEKETIGSPAVAEILQVSMSSIYRMTLSKELKPISGPLVDGYPVNLYLRSAVEEIKVARDAFRSECVRVGKTVRYSKSSGNRSCPVQENVMHRVKQLLEERLSHPEAKQRIAGLELHRQLVKEGYKIGTTTVYKVLHKQLAST